MPADRNRVRVSQEKPEPAPSSEQTPAGSTKTPLKLPPNTVDVTSQELGRGYVFTAAPPPASRSKKSKD
jgi:hypothetical protein